MDRLAQARSRIAYFEALLQPKTDGWTFLSPGWERFYREHIAYWQGVLNEAHQVEPMGSLEKQWAKVMDLLSVPWEYQSSFWLPRSQTWLKTTSSRPTTAYIEAACHLQQSTGRRVDILVGKPAPAQYAVWLISEAGGFLTTRPIMCAIALSNLWKVKISAIEQAMEVNRYNNGPCVTSI